MKNISTHTPHTALCEELFAVGEFFREVFDGDGGGDVVRVGRLLLGDGDFCEEIFHERHRLLVAHLQVGAESIAGVALVVHLVHCVDPCAFVVDDPFAGENTGTLRVLQVSRVGCDDPKSLIPKRHTLFVRREALE